MDGLELVLVVTLEVVLETFLVVEDFLVVVVDFLVVVVVDFLVVVVVTESSGFSVELLDAPEQSGIFFLCSSDIHFSFPLLQIGAGSSLGAS